MKRKNPVAAMVYMGPPTVSPNSFLLRYVTDRVLSTSFVAIPMRLVTTIQNNAPGPPKAIAVATPTMFPVPMVAASSVVREESADTWPEDFFPDLPLWAAGFCPAEICLPYGAPLPPGFLPLAGSAASKGIRSSAEPESPFRSLPNAQPKANFRFFRGRNLKLAIR